ncbi:hypothetical protein QUF70_04685 [Desulfobacterales bacterium HSG17]|nr:hypothetical protein [Desulfobacterales bacterium HSG17]
MENLQQEVKNQESENIAVLITISNGLIEQVKICRNSLPPVNIVSDFVQTMGMESMRAAFKGDDVLLANAREFLAGNYPFIKRLAD